MSKRYSIAEARANFASVVHEAENGERVELTRRGRPVAVLISLAEYQQLSTRRPSFWEAYEEFRHKYEGSDIDTADVFTDVRDSSPGRDFSW